MQIKTQAHTDLMAMFEREYAGKRFDKEQKTLWPMGRVYQDGFVNELFLAYRKGCAYGAALGRAGTFA